MKKILLVASFIFINLSLQNVRAQDIIILHNGDEISVKVLKVTKDFIEYKKWKNLNGPSYEMEISEVFLIKYQNGEKDVFKQNSGDKEKAKEIKGEHIDISQPQGSLAIADENNSYLIRQINDASDYFNLEIKKSNKKAEWLYTIFGVTDKSILSSEEIEIGFGIDNSEFLKPGYFLKIKNKSLIRHLE